MFCFSSSMPVRCHGLKKHCNPQHCTCGLWVCCMKCHLLLNNITQSMWLIFKSPWLNLINLPSYYCFVLHNEDKQRAFFSTQLWHISSPSNLDKKYYSILIYMSCVQFEIQLCPSNSSAKHGLCYKKCTKFVFKKSFQWYNCMTDSSYITK